MTSAHASHVPSMPSVLLVEDDPDLAELLQELFVQVGWTVRLEHNGADALRSLKESPPDVLVTDCMMPQMSGRELVELMKGDPRLTHLPVILMSGADSMLQGIDPSHQTILRKPFDPEALVDMAFEQLAAPGRRH
jgi:CheY-like chemotaxis protein